MSMGPLGSIGSVAGSPLAQTQGAEAEKAQQDTADQTRRAKSEKSAEKASGVGDTEQDEKASDRDADGRRPWELPGADAETPEEDAEADEGEREPLRGKDPHRECGQNLDLSG